MDTPGKKQPAPPGQRLARGAGRGKTSPRTAGRIPASKLAPQIARMRAQGVTVAAIAAKLQRSERYIYEVMSKASLDGTTTILEIPDFVPFAGLDPEVQERLRFTADGFEKFFNAYSGYKPWPGTNTALGPIHKKWVRDALGTDQLLVNCPPRHAKSEIFSVWFPIWLIAGAHACMVSPHDPDDYGLRNVQILSISQTDKLAKKFTNKIAWHLSNNHKLIADFGRFRPEMGDWPWRPNSGELMVDNRNRDTESGDLTIQVRGSGQQVLGMEANWVIVDDAVSRENATHDVQREQLSEWFHGDVMTRLEPGGRAIVIGQRLHLHDLYGELAAEGWRHINYKAVLDEDSQRVLWPEKWSWDDLQKVRRNIGSDMFESMYQQNPLASGRRLARNEWLYGDDDHPGCVDHQAGTGPRMRENGVVRVVSLDPSPTRYAGLVVGDLYYGDQFRVDLIELVRDKMSVRDMLSHLERVWSMYRPDYFIFEQVAAQRWFLQDRGLDELKRKMQVVPHNTGKNKGDPAYGVESMAVDFEFGRIRCPYGDAESKAMTELLFEEVKTYPQGKTDDLLMALWFIKFNHMRLVPRDVAMSMSRGRQIPPRLQGGWKWWRDTHTQNPSPPPGSSFVGIEQEEEARWPVTR